MLQQEIRDFFKEANGNTEHIEIDRGGRDTWLYSKRKYVYTLAKYLPAEANYLGRCI